MMNRRTFVTGLGAVVAAPPPAKMPGFDVVAWFGIVAPPKTPGAIAERVAAGVAEALKNPEALKKLNELSAEPMGLTPSETASYMKRETERWGAVIRSGGVKLD
jgi:tripartite-type tricarboxylate transporter receptor subunit TctC